MIGWIAFLVTFFIALFVLLQQRSQAEAERRRLQDAHRRAVEAASEEREELEREHSARIKRLERAEQTARSRAHLPLVKDLLHGLDDLERAIQIAREQHGDEAELTRGLELVERELRDALARHDVTPVDASPGALFDPNVHEAVAVAEREDAPNNTVDQPLRTGWRHSTTVLRPAMVQIVKSDLPAPSPDPGPEQAGDEEVAFDFEEGAASEGEEQQEAVEEAAAESAS